MIATGGMDGDLVIMPEQNESYMRLIWIIAWIFCIYNGIDEIKKGRNARQHGFSYRGYLIAGYILCGIGIVGFLILLISLITQILK